MSGTAPAPQPLPGIGDAQATGPLTDAEKADIRYMLGYSMYGNSASGFEGYRFFQSEGLIEYRILNASPSEIQTIRQMVGEIQALRVGVVGAAANLDTESAAVWRRNQNEVRDRTRLRDAQRRELAAFIGVPPGLGLGDGRRRIVI